MALDEYKRKRNFTRTPEPAGETSARKRAAKNKPLFFCVQKHLASQLHYDFRLEYGGVLLSWAVPKGPSLDPSIKRLAMHVEDHPIEYGAFEGVIPEGYGAGIVVLWDTGTWTPEVDDIDAALAKGDLKFTLDGYKLKGSWALIRTRGYGGNRGDGRSWLLIKHRDDWAGDLDITTFAPRSVKTKQDFAEILAADNPPTWHTNRPGTGSETNALLHKIIEEAALIRAGRAGRAGLAGRAERSAQAPKRQPKAPAAKQTAATPVAPTTAPKKPRTSSKRSPE